MKKIFTLHLLILFSSFAFAQSWDWTRVNQGQIRSIAIDAQQFFVTVQDATLSPGQGRGLLTRRNREGNKVWQKIFTHNTNSPYVWGAAFAGVITDNSGNIYTSNGRFDSVNHVFCGTKGAVSKFDFTGNLLWSRTLKWIDTTGTDFGDVYSSEMAKDEQDNIYVTGVVGPTAFINFQHTNKRLIFGSDTIYLPNPGSFMIVAKLDKDGNRQWIKAFNYTIPADFQHRTRITSIAVKNNQVAIAGTSNITTINFDGTFITGNKGTNFLTLLNASTGGVKWVKNITFNTLQPNCMGGCDAPTARVICNDKGKIIFASTFKDTLMFGGVAYGVGNKKVYYAAQYDTSGTEEVFKLFPNDYLGTGVANQSIPFYQQSAITSSGNGYYYHVLSHLYKLDSALNITWTSTNANAGNHSAIAADPSGNLIGVEGNVDGQNIVNGIDTIGLPNNMGGYSNLSRVNNAYNIVSGYAFYDLNSNGSMDPGEPPVPNLPIGTIPGTRFPALSDSAGMYQCLTDTGSFTFAPLSIPRYYTFSPVPGYSITTNSFGQHLRSKNFAFTAIPGVVDMGVDIIPVTPVRPGFGAKCLLKITNYGTVTQTGTVNLRLSDRFTYLLATPPPQNIIADTLVFAYNNIAPRTSTTFVVEFRVNVNTPLGEQVTSLAVVYPVATDSLKTNNYDTLQQIIRGAFDPNDKAVNLAGNVSIDKKSQALEYTIRFQNTGNDTAFNIRIDDMLSDKLDIRSFELVSSTHKVKPVVSGGRLLSFYFDNILLADSNRNEPLSHGAVQFRIKPLANIQLNDSITNQAGIYFDYNAPVITNTTRTKYVGTPTVNLGADISICGTAAVLNAGNAGARFAWSTGDTLQSLNVTASGTYWVRVTNSYGFSASDTIQVTLKPLPVVNLGADISQCGGTVSLNAGNSGSSFLWSNGAATQGVTVNTSGSYSVRVTNADGCTQRDTIQVTINPLPTVNLGADITQCGGNVTLNAANSGSSYLWSNGATAQNITVAASGMYSVKVTNASGCFASDTIQATINPLPAVNLGADITQCGGNVTLNAANSGSSYLWSNGATTQNITVAASGMYSVKVTNAGGCFASDTIQVTIKALPVVNLGADISQCGGSAGLNAGNSGGSFLWSNGAVTQSITVNTTGSYSVLVTNTNGCTARDTIQVRIFTLPVPQFSLPDTVYASDQPLLLVGSPAGGQFSGTGVTNSRFNPAAAGRGRHTLQYTYTDANGCSALASASLVVIAPPGNRGFNIYPNPNRGNFTLVQAIALRNSTLTILTPSGQVVARRTLYGMQQELRLSLRPGLYYLQLRADGFIETKRMVVVQ